MSELKGGLGKSSTDNKPRETSRPFEGIVFPPRRIGRYIKEAGYSERVGLGAQVYLAAVLEYLVTEILEIAGTYAKESKKRRITPRHIQVAIRSDPELALLLQNVTICEGGVLPTASTHADPVLFTASQNTADEDAF